MGYYEGQPVPPFSKHLGAASEATPVRRGTSQVFTILRCVSNVGKMRQFFFFVFFECGAGNVLYLHEYKWELCGGEKRVSQSMSQKSGSDTYSYIYWQRCHLRRS